MSKNKPYCSKIISWRDGENYQERVEIQRQRKEAIAAVSVEKPPHVGSTSSSGGCSLSRNELVALYASKTPLRKNNKAQREEIEKHLKQIEKARSPSDAYDHSILEARQTYARDIADKVWKSTPRPVGYSSASAWKSRKPTLLDVDALRMKAEHADLSFVEEYRVKAIKGELTKAQYYTLALVLFGDKETNKVLHTNLQKHL